MRLQLKIDLVANLVSPDQYMNYARDYLLETGQSSIFLLTFEIIASFPCVMQSCSFDSDHSLMLAVLCPNF